MDVWIPNIDGLWLHIWHAKDPFLQNSVHSIIVCSISQIVHLVNFTLFILFFLKHHWFFKFLYVVFIKKLVFQTHFGHCSCFLNSIHRFNCFALLLSSLSGNNSRLNNDMNFVCNAMVCNDVEHICYTCFSR